MQPRMKLFAAGAALALSQSAIAADFEAYGSLRLAVESVSPDTGDNYTGLRDAYSRVGVKFNTAINADWTLTAQLEVPLDLANQGAHSPYDQEDKLRIGKAQLSGPVGTLWYGRGWMAYYNAIAYPVDYFSSYYSGWATPTTFRREKTLYYASPDFNGLSFSAATTEDNGTEDKNRNQYVASYAANNFSLALGLDDNAGSADNQIMGLAASYTTGPWYIAGKYEEMSTSDEKNDGSTKNLLVQYRIDNKNTVRGMVADVDLPAWGGYGDTVIHLGWDHQYDDNLKVFLEYYQEESTAAISQANDSFGTSGYISGTANGGQAFTMGVRYDF
ncbi:MAG: porin [Pseudomonadota bacterium]